MTPAVRIINLMREMKVDQSIPLEDLFQMYKDESKFYRGRPEMMVMKMCSNQRNLQIFRGGKVQILGAIAIEEVENMRQEFVEKLKRLKKMESCQVTKLTTTNMVVSLQLPSHVNLHNITHSNHDLSYEAELFPAALIREWRPAHVAVFHNGKVIVTGVKNEEMLNDITHCINSFLQRKQLIK